MRPPADRTTLAACLQLRAPGPQASPSPVAALIAHPDPLLALASSQLILPALYPRLRTQHPFLSRLSPLSVVADLNRERNQLIVSDARSVTALLNSVGIEPIALKGLAYLLAGIFADPAERYLIDLDLLVPESQLPTALAVLANAAYHPRSIDVDPINPLRHHAPRMLRQGHMPVEIHRSIALGFPSTVLPAPSIIRDSLPITPTGHPELTLRLPSPEHLVTHLIIHSQITNAHSERIFPPLRALHDLACLVRHYPLGWCDIESRFRTHGQLTTLKLHLLQFERDFGFPGAIPFTVTRLEKLRWLRRLILNRWAALRFLDPVYLFLTAFRRRFRIFFAVVTAPGGLRSALQTLCKPAFYRRLYDDLVR